MIFKGTSLMSSSFETRATIFWCALADFHELMEEKDAQFNTWKKKGNEIYPLL